MKETTKIIELMKEVKFKPFPNGCGLDVSVKHQLPDHAFEAIATHLLANGVTIPVQCKECAFRDETMRCQCGNSCKGLIREDNDFCSYGIGKEQGYGKHI